MLRSKKILCVALSVIMLILTLFVSSVTSIAASYTTGYVNATDVRIRSGPSTSGTSILGKISNVTVEILEETNTSGGLWYKIKYGSIVGYIYSGGSENWVTNITVHNTENDTTFEQQLAAFPDDYKEDLRRLHAVYPNWKFEANYIVPSLAEVVANESVNRRKQVNFTADGVSWRSMGEHSYDWGTGKWAVTNDGWTGASREVIAYYADPRNFLNSTDIFMFAQQSFDESTQNAAGVEKIVAGTFLAKGYNGGSYISDIMEAAKQTNVSPYVIASMIIQEQGVKGTSSLISGESGYYNFFNVKASGATREEVIANGLNYAQSQGWDTRLKSIIGGANFYATKYISVGQDTYFYMNFNIIGSIDYNHQYAQNVYDSRAKGRKMSKTYINDCNSSLTFKIPVYSDMPATPQPMPVENEFRNNYYFTEISVSGLTPTFKMYTYEYNLSVLGDTYVKVAVPSGTEIVSPMSYALNAGNNTVTLTVKAETGYTTDYVIYVASDRAATLTLYTGSTPPGGSIVKCGDTNGDGKVSLIDLANVQKHLLGISLLTGDSFTGGDTNGDGKISLIDLANIQKHLLGVKSLEDRG